MSDNNEENRFPKSKEEQFLLWTQNFALWSENARLSSDKVVFSKAESVSGKSIFKVKKNSAEETPTTQSNIVTLSVKS